MGLRSGIRGAHGRNLFLRNKKGDKHYLVVAKYTKRIDLKRLENMLGGERVSFDSEARLEKYLGLSTGAVSPFGLINDVEVIIDSDLQRADPINFHPNVNTATVSISFVDFRKFLDHTGNKTIFIKI